MASSFNNILAKLPTKFDAAKKSGALYFFDSTVQDVEQQGRNFQLRICPALANKQKAKVDALAASSTGGKKTPEEHDAEQMKGKSSPFEPPYVEDLYVGEVESGLEGEKGMTVLLNKYAVLPEHFLLVTKEQTPQHLPPTPHELLLAYNLLLAAVEHPTSPRRLMAFYNGGEGAGASQSWRHLQFVEVPTRRGAPVESWVKGLEVERKDKPFAHPSLPHLHLLHHLPPSSSATWPPTEESNERTLGALALGLMGLLDSMFDALRRGGAGRDGGWNLLMTLDHLHLIPRSNPSYPLSTTADKPSVLEVNALGYAGMLLVKSEEELASLEKATEAAEEGVSGLLKVLEHCGVPRTWSEGEVIEEGPLAGEQNGEAAKVATGGSSL